MATYQYQDYMELKKLFCSYLKEGVPMSQEVKQVYWEDLKRMERETRCRTQSGTRCMKKCSECDMRRDGSSLSLDHLMDLGYTPEDSFNVEDFIETLELSDALYMAIDSLRERDQMIILMYISGYTEREIAEIVGACQKSVNNWKNAALAELRVMLKYYR